MRRQWSLVGIFHFYSNSNRTHCKQSLKTLIRRRTLQRLIKVLQLIASVQFIGHWNTKVKVHSRGYIGPLLVAIFNMHSCLRIMRGSRKFCQRGSNFDDVFLVDEEREDPKYHYKRATIIDPPAKRHLNGVSLACRRWRADDVSILNASLKALWFSGDPDQYC